MKFVATFPDELKVENAQQALLAHDSEIGIEIVRSASEDTIVPAGGLAADVNVGKPMPMAVFTTKRFNDFGFSDERKAHLGRLISGGATAMIIEAEDESVVESIVKKHQGALFTD